MSATATDPLALKRIPSIHQLKDIQHLCLGVFVIIPCWTEMLGDNVFTVNRFCLIPAFVAQILKMLQEAKMSWARGSVCAS